MDLGRGRNPGGTQAEARHRIYQEAQRRHKERGGRNARHTAGHKRVAADPRKTAGGFVRIWPENKRIPDQGQSGQKVDFVAVQSVAQRCHLSTGTTNPMRVHNKGEEGMKMKMKVPYIASAAIAALLLATNARADDELQA